MSSLPIVKQNVLTFRRLKSINVTAYDIIAKEVMPDGSIRKRVIDTIPNPTIPQLVKYRYTLPYEKDQQWKLPEDVYYDIEHPVEAFLNGVKVNPANRTYSEKLRLLTVIVKPTLKETDLVEVEYWKDEIQYTHSSEYQCEYFIQPVINYAYNMGYHNVLK